jgi:Cu(I)/Ag(I) efflux system membrane protein CusA/SilA
MTVASTMLGLMPILWGTGTGASIMKRIAAPMVGGMISSTVLTLVVIPAIYSLWKEREITATLAARNRVPHGTNIVPPRRPLIPAPSE